MQRERWLRGDKERILIKDVISQPRYIALAGTNEKESAEGKREREGKSRFFEEATSVFFFSSGARKKREKKKKKKRRISVPLV